MIQPTVGRVVWFYRYHDSHGHQGPHAAIIAFVHSDAQVNLTICRENGQPYGERSIPLLQDGEQPPKRTYCRWMPFQIGQAKKTEAAEKALSDAYAEEFDKRIQVLDQRVDRIIRDLSAAPTMTEGQEKVCDDPVIGPDVQPEDDHPHKRKGKKKADE